MRAGNVEVVAPELKELKAAGLRLAVTPLCDP
jgi:hypothetical protein